MDKFHYLKLALAVVLGVRGREDARRARGCTVPVWLSLGVIGGVLLPRVRGLLVAEPGG